MQKWRPVVLVDASGSVSNRRKYMIFRELCKVSGSEIRHWRELASGRKWGDYQAVIEPL
jgi:hypothetical protein